MESMHLFLGLHLLRLCTECHHTYPNINHKSASWHCMFMLQNQLPKLIYPFFPPVILVTSVIRWLHDTGCSKLNSVLLLSQKKSPFICKLLTLPSAKDIMTIIVLIHWISDHQEMTYLREGTLLQGSVRKIFPYGAQVRIAGTNRRYEMELTRLNALMLLLGSFFFEFAIEHKLKKCVFPL